MSSRGPLFERIALAVLHRFPYALCLSCLAEELAITELEVRNAAQMMVIKDAFTVVKRICYGCSRRGDTLAPEKDLTD